MDIQKLRKLLDELVSQGEPEDALFDSAKFLADLVESYIKAIDNEDSVTRDKLAEQIKIAGKSAAFFGGFEAMTLLHDGAVDINPDAGYYLNRLWDGIGGWWR